MPIPCTRAPSGLPPVLAQRGLLTAAIFGVNGVLLASQHERAWREALTGLADPERKPRATRSGGMAALGSARLHEDALLRTAEADMVVSSLDQVSTDGLAHGLLCRWPA